MGQRDNHKENNSQASKGLSISAKIRAGLLGLTPSMMIFKFTLATSAIIALAAGIIWYTASDQIHVNIDKVETATVVLSGADDLGGIGSGEYKAVSYSITNQSTAPAYVFVRIEMATLGLYEVVGLTDWCELTDIERDNELIFAYGELGALTPVDVGDEVSFTGRLHCLADAVQYSTLTGADMDIDIHGCLVYGTAEDGGSVGYNTGALRLWEKYLENK